jgi:ATP-dependent Clp protease ATP-binding subunit ClpC
MKNFNFTPRSQKLIKLACTLAENRNSSSINCLHFLLAFTKINQDQIEQNFVKYGVDKTAFQKEINSFIDANYKPSAKKSGKPLLNEETKELLNGAKALSNKFDHKFVGIEHIFICLFETQDELFKKFINSIDIPFNKICADVEESLLEDDLMKIEDAPNIIETPQPRIPNYKNLQQYSICLNEMVINGKINNLHVNQNLIQKISEILCRKNKNNPLVVGEAGVGKTALIESLAQVIVKGECSDFLLMKRIYALDIPMIVGGCKYRGEFEEKIKNILKEVSNDLNVILFIDEIHTIIGAGNPENGMDVANILKPYLARGDISCIGATTFDEYRKTIADDPALSRRFQIIKIEEPNKEETFNLIKSTKHSYEDFHIVSFSDDIIRYSIDMADKYLSGRFPDKVLDLLDQTGSKIKLGMIKKTPDMQKIEAQIKKINENPNINDHRKQKLLTDLLVKFEKATIKMIHKWRNKRYEVKESDVLCVISNKTNIPIDDLTKQDFEKLKNTKSILEKELIGQSLQVDQIYKCLIRSKAGFRDEKKPLASMLFAGPTGVGKTFCSKLIAENLYSNKNSFIYIDMSEYADKTAINKLIGSSPGYIGYDKGGILTEKIKKNGHSIILFDEIQKADPDILFSLLQILEEGKITDTFGSVVDFSNCIIIMTTNVGAQAALSQTIGFNAKNNNIQSDVISALKSYFPADLLNRIDEIIVFNNLNDIHLKNIIKNQLNKLIENLSYKKIKLSYTDEVVDFLYNRIQLNNFGARQVDKTIQRELQTLIAEKIIDNIKITQLEILIQNNNICVI